MRSRGPHRCGAARSCSTRRRRSPRPGRSRPAGAVRADGAAVLIAANLWQRGADRREDLPAVAYAAWAFYGGAPRRGLLALGLAVFRWALSAPNAGGAVSRRAIHESRAAVRAAASRIAAAPLEDLSREQLFRAALLGRVAQVWDNDAATANDAWAVVLEAVAALGAGAARASRRWRRWREGWSTSARRRRDGGWAGPRVGARRRGGAGLRARRALPRPGRGAGPPRVHVAVLDPGAGVAAPLAPVVWRDITRLRARRARAQRTRACEDAAADARGRAPRREAGTAAAAREPTRPLRAGVAREDGGPT